jgi:N-methylhydantoinase B
VVSEQLNAVELGVFSNRMEAVCEEMGAVLQRSAFSPNIKDRLDFSCAIFDRSGELAAQAAHIPVHLGSMAYAMADIVNSCDWAEGDMLVVNDPFLGGTHLPDVTVIAPVFVDGCVVAFMANRAHHANIGGSSPGSMPLSTSLEEEGVIIPPTRLSLAQQGPDGLLALLGNDIDQGDFVAQISANRVGLKRLLEVVASLGVERFYQALVQLNDYGERLAAQQLETIPCGEYRFTDYMDDDGAGVNNIAIALTLTVDQRSVVADFNGTAEQVSGNINCPLSVAAAAVFYVFRCLMPANTPSCAGVFRPIHLQAPKGCLLNAQRPAAVAAGNVETSTRITDVVLGALAQAIPERIPAASHGSMNNIAMGAAAGGGSKRWDYYETIGGGMGASALGDGLSGVQTHMTNTLNTPVESLEMHYPIRLVRYALRRDSGGVGQYRGGDGIIREFEFLKPATVTLLTERRRLNPWGAVGGEAAKCGENSLNGVAVEGKCNLQMLEGDRLCVASPGGGGWGKAKV